MGLEELEDLETGCEKEPDEVLFGIIITIVIIGIVGNASVFVGILVLKEIKKSMSNWYMLHLTVANILFLIMLPFSAYEERIGEWTFSTGLCKAKEGILMVNYYAGVVFLVIMSLDLFLNVTRSPTVHSMKRMYVAVGISVAAWIVCMCLPVPLYMYSDVDDCEQCVYHFPWSNAEKCEILGHNHQQKCLKEMLKTHTLREDEIISEIDIADILRIIENNSSVQHDEQSCGGGIVPRSYRIWLYTNFAIMLVVPLILQCVFYGTIIRTMMSSSSASENTQEKRNRRRVTAMMIAMITLFAVAWIPWYVVKLALVQGVSLNENGCRKLTEFSTIMVYLYSAFLPYIYAFMAPRFYRRFIRDRLTATPESHVSQPSGNGDAQQKNDVELQEVNANVE